MNSRSVLLCICLLLSFLACISHAQEETSTIQHVDSPLFTPALLKVMLKRSLDRTLLEDVDCSQCVDCCKLFDMSIPLPDLLKTCFVAEHLDWTCSKTECPVQYRKRMNLVKQFDNSIQIVKNSISQIDQVSSNDIRKMIKEEMELAIDDLSSKSLLQKMDALLATSKINLTPKVSVSNNICKPWMSEDECNSMKVSPKVLVALPPIKPAIKCKPWMSSEMCDSLNKVQPKGFPNMFPCSPWMNSEMCDSLRKKYAGCPYHTFSECDAWLNSKH